MKPNEFELLKNPMEELTGRELKSTFWADFSIAEIYGEQAIRDTFENAFSSWKNNAEYVSELTVVLNHKIWAWHFIAEEKNRVSSVIRENKSAPDMQRIEIEKRQALNFGCIYHELWQRADAWCLDNLTGEELRFYLDFED